MDKPLIGKKAAFLVANGFSEQDLIVVQRLVQNLGGETKIVSMDQGLVNSWNGSSWGLNFAADFALNQSLAADYSLLVIPGGQRGIDKLKLTAHTKRFINGFLACGKPVVALNEALDILLHSEVLDNQDVTGSQEVQASVENSGLKYVDQNVVVDANLLTGRLSEESQQNVVEAISSFLIEDMQQEQAVAA